VKCGFEIEKVGEKVGGRDPSAIIGVWLFDAQISGEV
jgi:hypothetical protein